MFLLEENNIKKRSIDKKKVKKLEFKTGSNNKKYKVKSICNNIVYAK